MQVFIILATVSLIIIFSILKYFEYRKENTGDCEGEWSWSECNKKCSDGDSVRYGTFNVTKEATFEGKCEAENGEQKTEECPASECPPEDCVGDWVWDTQCVGYCSDEDAFINGEYVVSFKEKYNGQACPHEDGDKDVKTCPVDMCPSEVCKTSINWNACDKPCSTGESKRTGTVSVLTSGDYVDSCEYTDGQTIEEDCPETACPAEDCQGDWVQDDACQPGLCSDGAEIGSTYVITKERANGGRICDYDAGATKNEPCPDAKCPPENCQGDWEMIGTCSGPCGGPGNPKGSTIKEKFKITKSANSNGTCEFEDGTERPKLCPDNKCPIEHCEGGFETLQLPNCDDVGENEVCVKDGYYFSTNTNETGILFPEEYEFQIYKSVGPFFGGNGCLFEEETTILIGPNGQYSEVDV